ncbi:secretion protein HlyD [Methylocaldum marinum]|uniref:Secretion protein HlyD n=1 Tax=Methylocaldum marinum TaxID=1432792 RepID=A0A250KPM3_9GAMM|nr:efflux RND transporter periplasmic adaptor subunit [Methylocaldum marinum]BBA33494.1 secretion protein HlyD [Methylocaldum marinum]
MAINSVSLRILVPPLLLSASAITAWTLIDRKSEVTPKVAEREPPVVDVVPAKPELVRLNVHSQGVVAPRSEINLVAEIAGKVIRVHPAFAAGGFFKRGDVLVSIEPRDYDFAVTKAQALVAEARKELLREQEEAAQAAEEWQALGGGEPSEFVLHKPHLEERRAKLAAAEAELAEARLRRARCALYAPFAGRVRSKQVDVGQYVTAGETLGRLYATDVAEVRLPIAADQAEFLDLPLSYADGRNARIGPAVSLSARFGGKLHHWEGKIVRTEGVVDEKTGMLYAVAEIREPYGYREDRPPLAVGLFVHAEIEGLPRNDLVRLPQAALHSGYQVYLVDSEGRLRLRNVEIVHSGHDELIVSGGLAAGDSVMVSGVDLPVEGMRVTVAAPDVKLQAESSSGNGS